MKSFFLMCKQKNIEMDMVLLVYGISKGPLRSFALDLSGAFCKHSIQTPPPPKEALFQYRYCHILREVPKC